MISKDLLDQESSLRDLMISTIDNQDLFNDLLSEYGSLCSKIIDLDPDWRWNQVIEFQTFIDEAEVNLYGLSQDEWDRYCVLVGLVGVLLDKVI